MFICGLLKQVTLKEYVHRIDPEAFIAVLDAYEILGKRFKSLREKDTDKYTGFLPVSEIAEI
jgi:hypothetical protein